MDEDDSHNSLTLSEIWNESWDGQEGKKKEQDSRHLCGFLLLELE